MREQDVPPGDDQTVSFSRSWIAFALPMIFSIVQPLMAQAGALPPVNLGETSFLDGQAGPGWLLEEFTQRLHDDQTTGDGGEHLPGSAALASVSSLSHFAYIGSYRILGAWYGGEVLLSAAHVDLGNAGATSGLGALTIGPVLLQWPEKKLFGHSYYGRFLLDMELPTGAYSPQRVTNVGFNSWTIHPHYAFTYFPTSRLETSWRIHYLWSGVNESPPSQFGFKTTQAGQAVHFNATLGVRSTKRFYFGANGYFLKQFNPSLGDNMPLPASQEQLAGLGSGGVAHFGSYFLFVNEYHEFGARNTQVGNKLVSRLEKIFAMRTTR